MNITQEAIDRFESRIQRDANAKGCWKWKGYVSPHGYGEISIKHRSVRANRFSYTLYNGAIPDGLNVLHSCDNPACVNPAHLFVGTHADNIKDKVSKQRQARGVNHGMAKITPAIVYSIRMLARAGKTQKFIAQLVGLTQAAVSLIVIGEKWGHVHADLIMPKQKRFGRGE